MKHKIAFRIIDIICQLLVSGRHNTTADRLSVAAGLSRLAARIRNTPCTAEVIR